MLQQIYMQQMAQLQRDAILNNVSLVQAPDPPSDDPDDHAKWYNRPKEDEPAPEAGSLDIPEGADNCLAGLTFVITGEPKHVSVAEGRDLIRRYGGKCMTAPSKNTSFVVLGTGPGSKKLATIKRFNLKVIDERGLFAPISGLPAYVCPMTEQKKDVDGLKKVTEDVPTTTTSLNQEQDLNSTAPISSQLPPPPVQQFQQQQHIIIQPISKLHLDQQRRAFLAGFKVFPAPNTDFDTPAYEDYRKSIMSTLTTQVTMQASAASIFGQIHEKISQLESTGQTMHPSLESEKVAARTDLQVAKTRIDAIRKENQKNRLAWIARSAPTEVCKEPLASATASPSERVKHKLKLPPGMTSRKCSNYSHQKRLYWDGDEDRAGSSSHSRGSGEWETDSMDKTDDDDDYD
jgi:hypothetical protein